MKTNFLKLFLAIIVVSGTQVSWAKVSVSSKDAGFDRFKNRLVNQFWKMYPEWASSQGFHKYDSVLVIPTAARREKEVHFCETYLDSLTAFPINDLSPANRIDYYLIENQLKSGIWSVQELKSWQWDPSGYNVSGTFADMLSNNYAGLDERIHNFYRRMAEIPAYYEAAKQNIRNPSAEHTKLAIEQNLGGLSVFEKDLEDALKKSHIEAENKAKVTSRAKAAVAAIRDYAEWLKSLDNKHPRSFRLGKDLYDKKFAFDLQSGFTAAEIYQKAIVRKEELHDDMYRLTCLLWPKYFQNQTMPRSNLVAIKMMIDKLSRKHANRDSFESSIRKQLPQLEKFIKAKNLLYIDPKKPLVVRREPDYMAGVAGASISAPGPYDKKGNTYYNVGSLSGWSDDKAESYLREYNKYVLQILNIHEAIPGHYTQLVYANQSPSIIKSILGSSAMIEGWAVYGERMMLEAGYDPDMNANPTESSPEMWLMYDKWHLRSVCNTILDYSVHTKNMSRSEAMNLLIDQAFQEKTEAEGKWRRVSVTQVQLCCYFTGYTEIYALRSKIQKNLGVNFDLRRFHEQFLSYGSAPVKYIRQLMLADPKNQKHERQFKMIEH